MIASRAEGQVEGNVTLHHQPMSLEAFRRHAGYVIQADRLLPNLTVEETLTYTAQLKFLGECNESEIHEKVSIVMTLSKYLCSCEFPGWIAHLWWCGIGWFACNLIQSYNETKIKSWSITWNNINANLWDYSQLLGQLFSFCQFWQILEKKSHFPQCVGSF